jgi:hypothetical protein
LQLIKSLEPDPEDSTKSARITIALVSIKPPFGTLEMTASRLVSIT